MARKKKFNRLVYATGDHGNRVRVVRRSPTSTLFLEVYDPSRRRIVRKSLKHRDVEAAKTAARAEAKKLAEGDEQARARRPTAGFVFARYLERRRATAEHRADSTNAHDERCAVLWTMFLGSDRDLSKLTLGEWEDFIAARSSGAIDAQGNPVPDEQDEDGKPRRRPVRARTLCADLKWLRQVIAWATTWQDRATGAYLMREDPTRGWKLPESGDPRRPVATIERYTKTREAAEQLTVRVMQDGKEKKVRSYLPELLDLAFATGRRIGAITKLRYRDLRLDAPRPAGVPKSARWYGAIVWPGETDKRGKEWKAPIDGVARAALDRVLQQRPPFNPDTPLFPALEDPAKPVRVDVVRRWLLQAEKLAGLPKLDGSLWHAYRRLWATLRKDLPVQDVAAAGGWRDLKTLMTSYQQADDVTTHQVVMHGSRASAI